MSCIIFPMFSEGWVDFQRVECEGGGFIDVWQGDCINNPNNENKSPYALNAYAAYLRLNGEGEWVKTSKMMKGAYQIMGKYYECYSAQEIWDYLCGNTYGIENKKVINKLT